MIKKDMEKDMVASNGVNPIDVRAKKENIHFRNDLFDVWSGGFYNPDRNNH